MTAEPDVGQPRDRGRPPSVDVDAVVACARGIVVDEGVSKLTMRRLGAELGVDPMVAYRFFETKDDLLEAIFLALLADVTPALGPDAVANVEAGFREFRRELIEAPSLFAVIGPRLLSTPAAMRPAAWVVTMLTSAGIAADDAMRWNTTLLSYVVGSLSFADDGRGPRPLSVDGLPRPMVEIIEDGIDFEAHFEWGFQRLLMLLRSDVAAGG